MNAQLKPQYTLTVDCDKCPGASCADCGGTGLIEVCAQCEHLDCLCLDEGDGFEPDTNESLWLVR
jgi:hypothetical protein